MPDLPDEQLDRLLARLGRTAAAAAPEEAGDVALDEIALQRLRRGALPDAEREALIGRLAADRLLREAWIESMEESIPLDETLEGRIGDAVLQQRRDEGLPLGGAAEATGGRPMPWLALAASLALAAGLGLLLYAQLRPSPELPAYQVTVSGQLSTVRGDEPRPEGGTPVFGGAGTVELTLHPALDAEAPAAVLRVAAVDPAGEAHLLGDAEGLAVEERDGAFHLRGKASELFGDAAGRWVLVAVLEPVDAAAWPEARLLDEATEAGAGAADQADLAARGGRRLVLVPLDYEP